MVSDSITRTTYSLITVFLFGLCASGSLWADDTEIYQSSYSVEDTGRPKVLIIFDNSGSMRTEVTQQPPAYDPNASYLNDNPQDRHPSDRIYWSTDGKPPRSNTNNYFAANKNRCAESIGPLSTVGIFQGKARRWRQRFSNRYSEHGWIYDSGWEPLSTSDRDPVHVDCEADVLNGNDGNGSVGDGFPFLPPIVDTYSSWEYREPNLEYSAAAAGASNVDWGSQGYTFYSAHYMDYLDDPSSDTTRRRIDIAKDVVKNLIEANPGIDFGLELFNYNNSSSTSGGRIVRRILDNDATASERTSYKQALLNTVDDLEPMTWTPLCEATYEAYNYLAGNDVYYGSRRHSTYDSPDRDTGAESPVGKYKSPATNCAYTYVILMTDGRPTYDTHANTRIEQMTGKTCSEYLDDHGSNSYSKNCLPELAEYMANTDLDNDTTNGDQYAITYTIGFTTDQDLLRDTATKGKGQYYTAESASDLAEAFQGAILQILATDSTFTSPAVAIDSFTRTQSRNDIFLSMFKPSDTTDWRGNIKKLKLGVVNNVRVLVDKNGAAAINPATREFNANASTYWSSQDGGNVEAGGVGALLAARDPASRIIKTNTGVDGALEEFNSTNIDADAFGLSDSSELFDLFGVDNQPELDSLLSWARGFKVNDDGTLNGSREWILADMLHSEPLVVNYGALGSFTMAEPDLRVIVGSNGGFLHMFRNDNGQESWAFFPKELAPILKLRAENATSTDHVYGIDSSPVLYTRDVNRDGTINAGAPDYDKAYVYFGLRRGGRALYALDISNPDSPSFMWKLDNTTSGFEELGQTWSNPVVARIPGYRDDNGVSKPVLIFGAGYDPNKDATGVATPDSMGRGLFIVDAVTGSLVWSVTPADNSATNLSAAGLVHSVAAPVSLLDSNGDGLTDRIYAADTGGNIWRVDLPGNSRPDANQNKWFIHKLAAMNGGTIATDRRFFSAPDIVRTSYEGVIYDAVLIGSGDRTNPNSTDVGDQFYMIRDKRIGPYFTKLDTGQDCDNDPETIDDFRCELPLGPSDLYDVTNNQIQYGATEEIQAEAAAELAAARGWRIDLQASGEKSLSSSLTLAGKVRFGTFSPGTNLTNMCAPVPGLERRYIVGLADATRDPLLPPGQLTPNPTTGIPDTPSIHVTGGPDGDGEMTLLYPDGTEDPRLTLDDPYGSYWYREEY